MICAPASITAPSKTTEPSTTRAGADLAPAADRLPPVSCASGATGRLQHSASPTGRARRGRRDAGDQVGRAADERRRRAEVEPVGGVDVPEHPGAGGEQTGEGLPLDRDHPPGRDGLDDAALEDVAAGVDLVGTAGSRSSPGTPDPAVRVGGHQPERPRVGDPDQVQRDVGVVAGVGVQQRAQVEAGEDVAVEDQHGRRRAQPRRRRCGWRRRCPAAPPR